MRPRRARMRGQVKLVEQRHPSPEISGTERIELMVPGRPEYVVVVRLAAAAIAGRMAFSFDDIEDLKVAVGEVCTAAILEGGPDVRVSFDVGRDQLTMLVRHRPTHPGRIAEEEELDKLLVRVLMDEVATEVNGGERVTRLVKRVAAT